MSTQNTETPQIFVDAIQDYLNICIGIDLAGDRDNKKARNVITEKQNSLKVDWSYHTGPLQWGFLNPQFAHLKDQWVPKCLSEYENGAKFVTIWPLISDIYMMPVYKVAQVHIVHGRIWPNVRGCMLCRWEKGTIPSISGARWDKKTLTKEW